MTAPQQSNLQDNPEKTEYDMVMEARNPNRTLRSAARQGFTLVEVMLVVIIIGIIAAFAVPNIAKFGDDAKIQKAITDLKSIEANLDLHELKKGKYPDSLEEISEYFKGGLPTDPWGNPYKYSKSGNGYDVYSDGKGDTGKITSETTL